MASTRRPVLFVSYPESGLINPLLVLAGELARRGVPDLHFATDENRRAEVEALSAASPVSFVSLGEVDSEMSATSWEDEVYRAVTQKSKSKANQAVIRQTFRPRGRMEKYARLKAAAESIGPALMVVDSISQFGCELAITTGTPFVLGVPFLPSNVLTTRTHLGTSRTPKDFPVPHSGLPYPMNRRQRLANHLMKIRTLLPFLTPSMRKVVEEDAELRRRHGIAPAAKGEMARIDQAELVLCYSIPEMDYPFSLPEKMRTVGALVPPLPQAPGDHELTRWLDSQDSVVYLGFGTITRLTREQVASLVAVVRRMHRHQFLWKLPLEQQHLLPPDDRLPENLRIEAWVPSQLDVLAHRNVRLFFTHAGSNGVHEGLYFGTPLVTRPLWMDCHDLAVRVQDLGLGLTLDQPETIDTDDVTDKLTRVLGDDSFRRRAELIGRLQRAAGGRVTAADLLLDLPALTSARPPRRSTAS
ncbi:glycosyltransferase [Lentzea albida]|uniref:Polyene glycosyltransferase n=1 Tax=Lentzea albida TaxID=65499 RepID=A0A1H9X727_9PSEU|nr:glycosyltransferase [Lentzea albida]SES41687.1 polyene glycosyltransferase [Lentzea albida]